MTLPHLPIRHLGTAPLGTLAALAPDQTEALRRIAERTYGRAPLALGDRLSRAWVGRHGLAVEGEIERVAATTAGPGAWMLNLSFEWGCTAAAAADSHQRPVLRRTLDWPLEGLGQTATAARLSSPAGDWMAMTWPGFVGVLTGFAPGRFAVSINQAPMLPHGYGRVGDWLVNRWRLWRNGGLPPALALREICETSADFATARARLIATPLAMPAIFTLVGTKPGEQVVVERLEREARVHDGPTVAANHWIAPDLPGRMRSRQSTQRSPERRRTMEDASAASQRPLDWLVYPVLNETTRLAVDLCPATGEGWAQGFEAGAPVTAVTALH
ncbi:MAG: hypothetical protein EAZ99_00735 [Alphaproteobacteria bacterium]|nr:hypothetical protein [Alphaproteobacteria bacterium]TAD91890.1 MAG: hypothetical protein EAZ99_00735 [Alphaproteobacteria bacterium]